MMKFVRELRRREVLRTAGLYVGICWIVIEASSIVLPTFGAPEWTLRAVIILAVIGFPIMLVLAWVYDVTSEGVVVQDEDDNSELAPLGSRKMDFVVIGLLSIALVFSVYLNFKSEPVPPGEIKPVTVLIADFDNQTGNELFDGSLEQALHLGIEGATFVSTYSRGNAKRQVAKLGLGENLNESSARLVAARQDVRMVLSGSIKADGSKFLLSLKAIEPVNGEVLLTTTANAASAMDVLGAVSELATDIRRDLGDDTVGMESDETVTAASIEALKFYTDAQELARVGDDDEAIVLYERAVTEDPGMARAYSGWGLSAFKLGREAEADTQWQKALSLLDRMTERERYRTLGLYYTTVSLSYDKAIDNYQQLVNKFPADGAGNNNLAILYTLTAQFDAALAQSEQLLTIYPGRILYHANHAQYALYAGDIEKAAQEAKFVIGEDPSFFKSYMILALTELYVDDIDAAKAHYARMAEEGGERGISLSLSGMADIAIYQGQGDTVMGILESGIRSDEEAGNQRGVATKLAALAHVYLDAGDPAAALKVLERAPEGNTDGLLVPSAEIFAANGKYAEAAQIADQFREQLRPTARAYARLIDGINALAQEQPVIAIDALTEALTYADLWIVRFYLAQSYLAAGYPTEAMAEFESCYERRSEAGGLFFDDFPTYRYVHALNDWRGKASKALADSLSASAR